MFIDLQQMPLPAHIVPQTTTLAAAVTAGATSLSTNALISIGNTAQFADGTMFTVTNGMGAGPFTLTVDSVGVAQSSGATITQVGASLWTGNGHVGATTGMGN